MATGTPRARASSTWIGPYHRATMPAGKALAVVVLALLLGGLLNVRSLTEAAERQPPGLGRSVGLVLVWPFQRVSEGLGLDQPRDLLAERLGREADAGAAGGDGGAGAAAGGPPGSGTGEAGAAEPLDALAVAVALSGEAVDPALADAVAIPAGLDPDAPAAAAAALPERLTRDFSATDELRVAVIGDSLTEQLGPALIAATDEPGVHAATTHDFTYSSGLSRPDFYDWHARAGQLAEEEDPDLWVVMLGANDAQDVRDADGRFRHIGSDEWEAIYRSRIAALMDALVTDGRAVIWVGQPIMRDAAFDESMAYVNGLYRAEADRRAAVTFVDSRRVFADERGRYADYLPGAGGQLVQMRQGDGVHLTRAGAARLADLVLPLLPVDRAPAGAETAAG